MHLDIAHRELNVGDIIAVSGRTTKALGLSVIVALTKTSARYRTLDSGDPSKLGWLGPRNLRRATAGELALTFTPQNDSFCHTALVYKFDDAPDDIRTKAHYQIGVYQNAR